MRPGDHISCTLWDILIQQYMSNGNAPTLQKICSCEENCRRTYTDWIAVSPETTETGVADLFYTVLFNGTRIRWGIQRRRMRRRLKGRKRFSAASCAPDEETMERAEEILSLQIGEKPGNCESLCFMEIV